MSRAFDWVMHLFFPRRCCLCGQVVAWQTTLCAGCRERAPFVFPPVCDFCGLGEDYCRCRRHHRAFTRCVMPFYYEDLGKRGVGQLKKSADSTVADGFAAEMHEVMRREYGGIPFDCITPVPLYKKEERERGYNPAALLARALAKRTGIAYQPHLRKLFYTTPQKELGALRRSGNLLGAFDVDEPQAVADKTILLVDDTVTTGATLEECAKMLKIYGAREIYAITAAASVMKDRQGEEL